MDVPSAIATTCSVGDARRLEGVKEDRDHDEAAADAEQAGEETRSANTANKIAVLMDFPPVGTFSAPYCRVLHETYKGALAELCDVQHT